jgi:hypothetical protein
MNGPQPNTLFGNAGRGQVKNELRLPRKGKLMSEIFSLWLKSPKEGAKYLP